VPLIDASSLHPALKRLRGDAAPILEGQTVLDLTIYELETSSRRRTGN